ncbi:hypothetical protein [Streptomyces sp. NPDC047028]|uniref:hypothetical protein n=1 Tax=Streptomyces sp. NPDC047028 TaxID=3155793 RepID=UPI0033E6C4D8
MSNTTPPPPTSFPPPPPPGPAPKKSHTNLVILGAAAAVIAAVVATGIVVVNTRSDDGRPAASAAATPTHEDAAATAATETDPASTYSEVDASSFTIKLKTTKRQCFGSAGCNMTVEPDLTFLGDSESIDPDAVYEITYEIHGDESGPVVETAELTDQTSLNYTPSVISTASSGTKVSVEITDVSSQGE